MERRILALLLWSFLLYAYMAGCTKDPAGDGGTGPDFDGESPEIVYLGLDLNDASLGPCAVAEACTLPDLTDFAIRFGGLTGNGSITGFQWKLERLGDEPAPWQPLEADTLFIPNRDTLAVVCRDDLPAHSCLDTLWSISGSTAEVRYRNPANDPLRDGIWIFRARVRDQAALVSDDAAEIRFVLNFDPSSRLFTVPACECPNPPPDCDALGPVPAGWITGIGARDFTFFPERWILFCEGDTLPNFSVVQVHVAGEDDPRDGRADPPQEVGYTARVVWRSAAGVNESMPYFSPPAPTEDLRLPDGRIFRGGKVEWRTCPFDYQLEAAAVDPSGRLDGSPVRLDFFVGGAPIVDSVRVPPVVVIIPTCPDVPATCPQVEPQSFGPDTLVVVGQHVPDPLPWQTPAGVGWNDFTLAPRAWAHDHPRDRNSEGGPIYYTEESEGRVRAWRVSLDCTAPGCSDLEFPNEGGWRNDEQAFDDPIGQQVFDDPIPIRVPLDTLCLEDPCLESSELIAQIHPALLGEYVFTIEGRDTDFVGQQCERPSDLGPDPASFPSDLGPHGRTTARVSRNVILRQLHEVRPAGP
ncbi:MAG: hypothetical protein JSW67_02610 [Candidatus Latescibacterota bacterium]|nr:MAG: hypothetical protein JSW67_02610 [Candidatus Latescibacterota bacterium]